jgi:cytochrome c peroxidase
LLGTVKSWSPAFRRRRHLAAAFGWARAGSARLRARRWSLSICVGLVLASAAAAQAAPPAPPPSCATTASEEPITPIPAPPVADPNKLALGEHLFTDPRLSGRGDLACSSCHDIRSNGAGGRKASVAQDKSEDKSQDTKDKSQDKSKPRFDTLTVFNAALNFRLNWVGNFRTLAAHVESALESGENMRTNVNEVVRKLNADPETARQFRTAYGRGPDRENVLDALVTFEQSLVTPGSRFDRWLGGDMSALSDKEQDGYRLFKSFGCSSCHQGVNVGGNLLERQGIFRPLVAGSPAIVRVPSLRNVAATAPYFHDGSAATLEDAIRRMAAAQLDRTLSDQQVDSLVAFLRTLTGTYRGAPVSEARQ